MKHLPRFLLVFLVILSSPTVRADDLDDVVLAHMKATKVPGLSLAVVRDGTVIRAAGYGMSNLELGVPATRETVYEIGSISKQFAAEASMLLVEAGKLKLTAPITDHLPPNAPPSWRAISVNNLLRHSSGLKDWTEVKEFSYRREYTHEEFIDLVREYPLEFQPNTDWKYSNTNLPLVGMIVEHASGQNYEQFVTDNILQKIGCPSIRFHKQAEIVSQRASGYVLHNDQLEHGEPYRPNVIAPSGGVLANVVDLAMWWETLLSGKLLQPESLQEILSPTELTSGRRVAHGLSIFRDMFNGHKMIHHHGSTVGGFGGVVRHFPEEKVTVAVLSNLEDGGWCAEYLSKRIANHYITGSFIGGLTSIEDAVGLKTAKDHLEILKKIAEGKGSELLAQDYENKITKVFREDTAKNIEGLKSFVFLGKESIGSHHFVLNNAWTEARYFRMITTERTLFYHFRCHQDGTIGSIFSEK